MGTHAFTSNLQTGFDIQQLSAAGGETESASLLPPSGTIHCSRSDRVITLHSKPKLQDPIVANPMAGLGKGGPGLLLQQHTVGSRRDPWEELSHECPNLGSVGRAHKASVLT